MSDSDKEVQAFIGWLPEFDCHVSLIDHQHRGILAFINAWYREIKQGRVKLDNLSLYLLNKFEYLDDYSRAHLGMEEKLLELLVRDHGFTPAEQQRHLAIHRRFIQEFMGSLADQVSTLSANQNPALLESLASEGLKDVARWWFTHIKTPSPNLPAGPDHVYRVHLAALPAEAKLALLNDFILSLEKGSLCNGPYAEHKDGHA
jgi:hemerythrin-like metal-binding protein